MPRWTNEDLKAYRAKRTTTTNEQPAPKNAGPKYRSKTEAEFHRSLNARFPSRTIRFEDITFRIGHGLRYTPDFSLDGLTFYEVKGGFIRRTGLNKLKTAAKMFPEYTFILAQKNNAGIWQEKTIEP